MDRCNTEKKHNKAIETFIYVPICLLKERHHYPTSHNMHGHSRVAQSHINIYLFPNFEDRECALKSYLHKLDDDIIGHPKLTAGIVTSDVNPVGAASRGLSRATAHVSMAMAVRSEMNGLEISRESPSRGH
jgi:hypothetical protein